VGDLALATAVQEVKRLGQRPSPDASKKCPHLGVPGAPSPPGSSGTPTSPSAARTQLQLVSNHRYARPAKNGTADSFRSLLSYRCIPLRYWLSHQRLNDSSFGFIAGVITSAHAEILPGSSTHNSAPPEYKSSSGPDRCKSCDTTLTSRYFRIMARWHAKTCAERLKQQVPKDSHQAFVRGIVFGVGAAFLGLILYAAFGILHGIGDRLRLPSVG